MKQWNTRQKQLVAEFLSNLALAVVTVGAISPLFELRPIEIRTVAKFTFAILLSMITLITSFQLVKQR